MDEESANEDVMDDNEGITTEETEDENDNKSEDENTEDEEQDAEEDEGTSYLKVIHFELQ